MDVEARRLAPLMRRQPLAEEFYAAFTNKGRMAEVLADIDLLDPRLRVGGR